MLPVNAHCLRLYYRLCRPCRGKRFIDYFSQNNFDASCFIRYDLGALKNFDKPNKKSGGLYGKKMLNHRSGPAADSGFGLCWR
jgi:hypothetical protein